MSKRDHKTGDVLLPSLSRKTQNRNLGLRHLLETDRMQLPDDLVEALEQLLCEMGWLVKMIKAGGDSQVTLTPAHHSLSLAFVSADRRLKRIATQQFRMAIQYAGLHSPGVIEADGKLHRFSSNGKRGDDAGWYVLYLDGIIPAGAFGDWRSGASQKWRADIELTAPP